MAEHTPGPWRTGQRMKDGTVMVETSQTVVAQVGANDARLIAAAPDLLAALEDVVRTYDEDHDCIRTGQLIEYRAALAKARGEA